jgi:hypothetical protein
MAGELVQSRYDVEVELDPGANAPKLAAIIELLGGVALGGREVSDQSIVLYLQMPADSLQQAITVSIGLVGQFGVPTAIWGIQAEPRRSRPAVPDFVGASEAAALAGRSRQAIHQQIATGSIKAGKVGREYTIRRALIPGGGTPD